MPHRFVPIPLFALLLCVAPARGQEDPVAALPGTTEQRLTADLRALASEEFEGRGVETEGIRKAADYVKRSFQEAGLTGAAGETAVDGPGGFFQPFEIALGQTFDPDASHLTLTGEDGTVRELTLGEQVQPLAYGAGGAADAALVFADYGISAPDLDYDSYAGLDVQGKVVLILRREPRRDDPASPFNGAKTSRFSYLRTKLKAAEEAGAAAVLLVNDADTVAEGGDVLSDPAAFGPAAFDLPFAQIKRGLADELLAASPLVTKSGLELSSLDEVENTVDAGLTPVGGPLGYAADAAFTFETKRQPLYNVAAVLEGEGPHADETVILGAHYDHLGYGGVGSRKPGSNEIHNGADDNASGTALLLELARRYGARARAGDKPPRRMAFIAFSAEERGLLGSEHYVTKAPLVPLETTRAMLNFDMVGRYGDNTFQLHGLSSSPTFPALVDVAAAETGVVVDRVDGVLSASDHWDFVKAGIPAFHFFTGLTPEYHKPEDDVETLNIGGMAALAGFAEALIDGVLSGDAPLEFVKPPMARIEGRQQAAGRPILGVLPADVTPPGGGVRIDEVVPGGPAARAGMLAGDVLRAVAGVPVADLVGLRASLGDAKIGQTVAVVVERGGEPTELNVTLGKAE